MCGICGQYNFGSLAPVRRADIEAMTKSISHRGPDDEGYYLAGPLGLGFRRLSTIDLAGGHQPMSDQEEMVWVIFNGEIYNLLGIYVLEVEALKFISPNTFFDMPMLFEKMIEQKKETAVFPVTEYWLDIGLLTDYQRANGEYPDLFE
jgi:asparagine synthetase B (glutamine-hydrolysing)